MPRPRRVVLAVTGAARSVRLSREAGTLRAMEMEGSVLGVPRSSAGGVEVGFGGVQSLARRRKRA